MSRNITPKTRKAIEHAFLALKTQGITRPTNEQIRDTLGGGSYTTISQVARELRRQDDQQAEPAVDTPDSVREAMTISLDKLWSMALTEARTSYEQSKKALEQMAKEAAGDAEEALAEIERLEQALHDADSKTHQLEGELNKAHTEQAALTTDNAVLYARLQEKDKTIGQLEAQITNLQSLLATLPDKQLHELNPTKDKS